jgi:hypothetical protein
MRLIEAFVEVTPVLACVKSSSIRSLASPPTLSSMSARSLTVVAEIYSGAITIGIGISETHFNGVEAPESLPDVFDKPLEDDKNL